MIAWITRNWGHCVGASLALLLAVTVVPHALADLNFDILAWAPGGTTTLFDDSVDPETPNVLSLLYSGPTGSSVTDTYTIVGTGATATPGDGITGNLASALGAYLQSGTFTIEVSVAPFDNAGDPYDGFLLLNGQYPFGNMFREQFIVDNENPLNPQPFTITIAISFQNAVFSTQESTPMNFTFSQVN